MRIFTKLKRLRLVLCWLPSVLLLSCSSQFQAQAPAVAHGVRNDLPRPYQTQRDWGELPAATAWAAVTAVEPSPDGNFIYVVHRCFANSCADRREAPILKYDYAGKLLLSFGQGLFLFPHGASVDYQGNLWVTDARGNEEIGHQVFKVVDPICCFGQTMWLSTPVTEISSSPRVIVTERTIELFTTVPTDPI
jgi:hypothetical protein